MFLDSVIGAVKWIRNDEPGDATSNPSFSKELNKHAEATFKIFELEHQRKKNLEKEGALKKSAEKEHAKNKKK